MARFLQAVLLLTLVALISAAVNYEDPIEVSEDGSEERGDRMERTFTPKKCCKIGRRVASKGLYCNIDLFQVEKKDNTVQREKMKFHGPESDYDTTYKNLMMKVEKCYPSKASRSMFEKCCLYQEEIERNLDNCKKLGGNKNERRECRRRIKSRE